MILLFVSSEFEQTREHTVVKAPVSTSAQNLPFRMGLFLQQLL